MEIDNSHEKIRTTQHNHWSCTWHISQIIVTFCLLLSSFMFQTNEGVISCWMMPYMQSYPLNEKMNHLVILDCWIDDDSNLNIELGTFAVNMKKEVCGVINYFFSFLTKYDENKVHNMLPLMLNARFKSLKLISFFIG